jgi:hypothetical protein
MIEKLQNWSAEDVFKDFIETAIAVFEDDPSNEVKASRIALARLLEEILHQDKTGLAEPPKIPAGLPVNVIPGSSGEECHPVLIGLCYDADYLDERLRQILDHAGRLCPRKNRLVVIISSQWNKNLWKEVYLREFEQIYSTVHIYLIGPSGVLSHVM